MQEPEAWAEQAPQSTLECQSVQEQMLQEAVSGSQAFALRNWTLTVPRYEAPEAFQAYCKSDRINVRGR